MKKKIEDFWKGFEKLDQGFGTEKLKLCKKHGFVTHLKEWNYCPYCGEELCE